MPQHDRIRRAFLSSTARDLSEHREAVYHALNKLGDWKCERMEDWGAQPVPVREVLERKIRRSDLFIGLVGALYGSPCPSEGQKVSYTRYEYEVACELGKPVLIYIVPDDVPLLSWNLRESDELHSLQEQFREMVRTANYFTFIKTPEEFATRVLLDIRNWERNWERSKVRHKAPAFQVPAPPQNLFGREHEIEQALTSLRNHKNVLLHGMRGAGKSAIAYQIAHELRGKQVYIDLKATSEYEQKATSRVIKEKVVRALQPEAMLSTENEIERVYDSLRIPNRLLIVLDSVHPEHIRGLRSPDKSRFFFIFTSYELLSFRDLDQIEVKTLSPTAACRVLQILSGDVRFTELQLCTIAELCGYLPLALRAAAGYLISHATDPVEKFIRMLRASPLETLRVGDIDVPRELAVPVKALDDSDPELARKWRWLSVFPGDFDDRAAGAVWPVFEHDALVVLSSLKNRNLVMYDGNSDRYRLHDLMRLIAQNDFSRSDEEGDRDQAYAQHAKYFLSVVEKANTYFLNGGAELSAGLQLFDREMPNIQAGHSWVEHNWETNKVAATLCKEYVIVGADVLGLRILPEIRLGWLETALNASQKELDILSEALLLDERGVVYPASVVGSASTQPRRASATRFQKRSRTPRAALCMTAFPEWDDRMCYLGSKTACMNQITDQSCIKNGRF